MKLRRTWPLLLLLAAGGVQPVPALTGPVVNQSRVLSASDRETLEALARDTRAEDDGRGVQLQFLLVPSLGGEPVEDFSIRVAEAWKIGSKGADNGLLFVVATNDHQMRLEVGGGLEGKLPDVLADHIVEGILRPAFRQGRFGPGLLAGAQQALSILEVGPRTLPPEGQPQGNPDSQLFRMLGLLALIVLLVFFRILRGYPFGGLWFGGSFGGGGSGGWSGGGGGFSGGGASGDW